MDSPPTCKPPVAIEAVQVVVSNNSIVKRVTINKERAIIFIINLDVFR